MLLSPLVLSFPPFQYICRHFSGAITARAADIEKKNKPFAENKNKRKTMDARTLICMHLCFCSDCENASGIWQQEI